MQLGIGERTVDWHLRNLKSVLGAFSRTDLVRITGQHGRFSNGRLIALLPDLGYTAHSVSGANWIAIDDVHESPTWSVLSRSFATAGEEEASRAVG